MEHLQALALRLGRLCQQRNLVVATAESCTGGWVAQVITDIPGSSQWFDTGYVTYSNESKQRLLGVPEQVLREFGAVSEETVEAMALGALRAGAANLSVAISGVAGPDGGTPLKPVGTVWFAWAAHGRLLQTALAHFEGDRHAVREQAVQRALMGLIQSAEHLDAMLTAT